MSKLLYHGIAPKSCGGIGSLPSCGWDESLEKPSYSTFLKYDTRPMQEASHAWIGRLAIVDSEMEMYDQPKPLIGPQMTCIEVLMLSKGVTASNDSVMPAPNPAITVLGPEILPVSSWRRDL